MTTPLLKIASALDLLADEWDRRPATPAADAAPDPLVATLQAELGDRWRPELAQKLAEDQAFREVLEPLVKRAGLDGGSVRPLGAPVEKMGSAPAVRRTPEEERAEAEAYFAARIMGLNQG